MNCIFLRISIAALSFLLGAGVNSLLWPEIPNIPAPDLRVYEVELCDLVQRSDFYDGKIVRLNATHMGFTRDSFGTLHATGCTQWVRTLCLADAESCARIRHYPSIPSLGVIGLYTANTPDPDSINRASKVHLLQIFELGTKEFGVGSSSTYGRP